MERPTLDQLIPTESASYAERRVEERVARLESAAETHTLRLSRRWDEQPIKAAKLELQRAALAYAAAKIAETGESGVMNAVTLLNQIAEDLA